MDALLYTCPGVYHHATHAYILGTLHSPAALAKYGVHRRSGQSSRPSLKSHSIPTSMPAAATLVCTMYPGSSTSKGNTRRHLRLRKQ